MADDKSEQQAARDARKQERDLAQKPAATRAQAEAKDEVAALPDDAPKYPIERLTGPEGPDLTGYSRAVIAGALHGRSGGGSITLEEAKSLAQRWLDTEEQHA